MLGGSVWLKSDWALGRRYQKGHTVLWSLAAVLSILISIAAFFTEYPYLAVIPSAGLVLLILAIERPQVILYTIIFLIPFGRFRSLGGPLKEIQIHWILAAALLAVLMIRLIVDRNFIRRFQSNILLWIFLFIVISLLSSVFTKFPNTSIEQIVLNVIAIVFIILVIAFADRDSVMSHIPLLIAISVSIGAFLAVIGNAFEISMFVQEVGDSFARSYGATTDANSLALSIIVALPFVIFLIIHGRSPWIRFIAILMLLTNLGGIVVTFSRSGGLVTAALLMSALFLNRKRFKVRHTGIFFAGACIVLLGLAVTVPESYWERQATLGSSEKDRSLSRRSAYVIVAYDAFLQRPILGHGPGTYRDIYAQSRFAILYQRGDESLRRYAHNTYLEVIVGTGIVGSLVFGMLLLATLRNFFRARRYFAAIKDSVHTEELNYYILSFCFMLLYLMMYSDVFQKFLLVAIGWSQVWVRVAKDDKDHSRN